MIFQGILNILDFYLGNIDAFYDYIDDYFGKKIITNIKNDTIKKENLNQITDKIIPHLQKELLELGFEQSEIENTFLDPFLEIKKKDYEIIYTTKDIFEKKIAPLIYELFLKKFIDYFVDIDVEELMLKLRKQGFLTIELIIELRNLKNLFDKQPEKKANLRKYIQIQEKIVNKFIQDKKEIESLEDLKNPQDKLQLTYLIYRIIDFFHLQKRFDFSHLRSFLKSNVDEWLIDIPLITLKNPDIYFCGIYLIKNLDIKVDKEKVKQFLLNLYEEAIDEFESPIIEATDGAYYFIKATEMMGLWLDNEKVDNLTRADKRFFENYYLRNLETSQLVVILKIYSYLRKKTSEQEINAIIEEIEFRITPEGIKQYRDGFISSEATYYVLFCNYMRNTLEKFKDYNLLEKIISRIYRNLELLDFSKDTNYDLISELFYSCESLKLYNCVENKQMIIHLANYLFPEECVNSILKSEEIPRINLRLRHLKVNRITGETIY
ncbi:MAG: hypothetical protein ACFFB0_09325 [Promethearchaeota archaeon]